MSSPPVQARTLAGVPRESRIIVATSENIPILRKLTTLELEEGASVSFFMSISRSRVLTRVHVKVETIDEIENEPVVVADFLAALDHLPPLMRAGDRIDVDASVAAHGLYELPNVAPRASVSHEGEGRRLCGGRVASADNVMSCVCEGRTVRVSESLARG